MSVPSDLPLVLPTEAVVGRTDPGSCLHAQLDHLLDAGVDWLSLPADLRSAYALGYYIGNVRNGAHSQFIGNAFRLNGVGPMQMLQDAALAAMLYHLPQTLAVIRQAQDWVAANPDAARMQTLFTGGRAAELDAMDKVLYAADLLDEAAWRAELASLGPAVAANQTEHMGLDQGHIRFPRNPSHLREMRFLLNREPRVLVEQAQQKDAIATAARDQPGWFDMIVHRRGEQLFQSMPKAATCAVLHLMQAHSGWTGLPDSATLGPVPQASGAKQKEAFFVVIAAERPHVAAVVVAGTVRLYRAKGDAPRSPGLSVVSAAAPKGLLARLFAVFDPKAREARRLAARVNARTQGTLRRAARMGQTPLQTGEHIAATLHSLGIPVALAVHLALSGAKNVCCWRLLRDKAGDDPGQIWLFGTEDGRLFEVAGVTQGIVIRDRATGKETAYPGPWGSALPT